MKFKRLAALALTGIMALATVGCAGETKQDSETSTAEVPKILVMSFDVSGDLYDAEKAYLDYLGEELGFEYEYVRAGFTSQEQITTTETYLAQGYKGVITCIDNGCAEAMLDLCEDYDAYLGGFWQDFGQSIYATGEPNMAVLANDRFVGSTIDGKSSCEEAAETMFNAIVREDGHTKIGIATMPIAWYPIQLTTGVDVFVQLTEEYNAGDKAETNGEPVTLVQTGTDDEGNPIYYEQVDGQTQTFSSSFFSNNDMTACASFASTGFTYGALVESKADIKLYATGWENEFADDFGPDKRIQMIYTSPTESIVFSLIQILDKINGKSYADAPTGDASFGKIVETDTVYNIGLDGLEAFKKSLHYAQDPSAAYYSAEDLKQMMVTYNENATFAELAESLNSGNMTIEAIRAR